MSDEINIPEKAAEAQARGRGFLPRLLALHLIGVCLTLTAALAVAWFVKSNPALPGIFANLFGKWRLGGGEFEWTALAWTAGAVAIFWIIGRLYLDGLELYLPRGAEWGLALLFGMGLSGFVLETLAIFNFLYRPAVSLGLLAVLGALGARAWRRPHRPPEGGYGGDAGPAELHLRRMLAREAFENSLTRPRALHERVYRTLAMTLIGLISLAITWHAVLYPEVYWDSLILYLGYARMTFLEHGFPVKVTGQVGIGLGANYPHLFSVLGSGIAAAAGIWSELPQRILASLCGVATTVLVYHTALRITRHVNFALSVALLYRATPLTVAWDQYASDYALVLLFGAGFLYLAVMYTQTRLRGYLWAVTLLIALGMHLNYLMGILWGPWMVLLLAAHLPGEGAGDVVDEDDPAARERREAPWTALRRNPGLGKILSAPGFWIMLAACGAIGATWLVRNYFVTGNPVYAFFYETLGGKNINPEVMKAAAKEWESNGWGIGRLGETLRDRMLGAWHYFVTATPHTGGGQAYLTQPGMLGFALGGTLVWLGMCLATPFAAARRQLTTRLALRAGWVIFSLFFALLAFHFVLAPFYLYQVIKLAPCMALLAALAWPVWRMKPWRWAFGALMLWTGLVPGLAMALMGFKIVGEFELPGGVREWPLTLYPLRNPLPTTERYYRMRFGDEALMWEHINKNLPGIKLLTHDNRHLVYDPSITLVHLDDWEMQELWREPDAARRVQRLVNKFNIHYYLRIPNELACPTNAKMGTAEWEKQGLMKLAHQAGETQLYQLTPPAPGGVPLANSTP